MQRAETLPNVGIDWQKPININCSTIHDYKCGVPQDLLTPVLTNKNKSAIYYFKLESDCDTASVFKSLSTYKASKERSCPKIDKKRSSETVFLYCGSTKKNLHNRLLQHLGKGHRHTYALQLSHWAHEINLKVEFNFGWIESSYKDFTELLESSLAEKLKPLVGKIA